MNNYNPNLCEHALHYMRTFCLYNKGLSGVLQSKSQVRFKTSLQFFRPKIRRTRILPRLSRY